MEFVRFKHKRFSARFPAEYSYSRSHYWMGRCDDGSGLWRVGFTKFATRMLGELVEANWTSAIGGPVASGEPIGTVEGFKAASDVFCCLNGTFHGGNPILDEDACIVRSDPYVDGWLYQVDGEPEEGTLSSQDYLDLMAETIRKMEQDPKYSE